MLLVMVMIIIDMITIIMNDYNGGDDEYSDDKDAEGGIIII